MAYATTIYFPGAAAWQRQATRAQEGALLGLLDRDLADGALGIGLIVG
ncbi:hypothetical protein [Streptomyces sp. NRRL B-1347]|nr:hypothetical protein [Streptomyces sp. NRRL B-1347]